MHQNDWICTLIIPERVGYLAVASFINFHIYNVSVSQPSTLPNPVGAPGHIVCPTFSQIIFSNLAKYNEQ